MSIKRNFCVGFVEPFSIMVCAVLLAACGPGASSNSYTSSPVQTGTTSGLNKTGTSNSALTTIPATTGNNAPIVVDAGPVSGAPSINVAYVSVTVCTPGTPLNTAACQTIDHVTLDTGSYGLRLLNSSLSANLNLPAVTTNGQAIGECTPFVIGTTWGSVRLADIYIGGEVAKNIPIQDIGDSPGGATTIPKDCTATGAIQNTQAALGANGILGVGFLVNDCDACLTRAHAATYYTCTSSGCTNSTVTAAQVVKNPVPSFQNPTTGVAQDNNGTLIELPAVSSSGSTGLTGSLIFGIGTQTNNAIPKTASVFTVDSNGNFKTALNGTSYNSSYLDSGSNGLFFNAPNIPVNSSGWYDPSAPMTLSATNTSPAGSPSGTITFTLLSYSTLPQNVVAAIIGGTGSTGVFAWGLPFFFGRPVFTAISGQTTPSGNGPYWAY